MLLGSVKEYKAQFSKTRKETSRLGLKFDEVQADGKFLMKMLKRDWDRVFGAKTGPESNCRYI